MASSRMRSREKGERGERRGERKEREERERGERGDGTYSIPPPSPIPSHICNFTARDPSSHVELEREAISTKPGYGFS